MMEGFNKRNNDYKDENGHVDAKLMEWDYMHGNNGFRKHELSDILKDMGFSEDSYMVVRKTDNPVKVADGYNRDGSLKENPYMTFGGYHVHPNQKENGPNIDGYEANNIYMRQFCSPTGELPNGITGANNGVYSAQAYMGNEIIITKDSRIVEALANQLSFKKDVMVVPMSNGGVIMEPDRRDKWARVCLWGDNVAKHIRNGDNVPAPKRLNIREEYDKVKAVKTKEIQNKMHSFSH